MAKVTVTFEFQSEAEAAAFFFKLGSVEKPPAAFPTQEYAGQVPVVSSAAGVGAVLPAAPSAQAPAADDPVKAVHAAMTAMIGRLDAKGVVGAGAAQAKAILNAHGLTRTRDVKPEQAPVLIAAFNSAV